MEDQPVNKPLPPMDIALALDALVPGADYRRAGTYAELAATWADSRPLPSRAELAQAWAGHLASRAERRARATDLAQARARYARPFDAGDYATPDALLDALVARVRWLESEIRDLHGRNASTTNPSTPWEGDPA
jgi:hypothetical protein